MRTVRVANKPSVRLTQREFELFYLLYSHRGQVLSSERLIETLWGYTDKGGHQLLRTTMERLRKKIEPTPHQPQYIVTVHDIGYQFVAK